MYIYQYNSDLIFFDVKTFPYKGIQYNWKDYHIIIDNKEYSICKVLQNKLDEYDIWLWASKDDHPNIKGDKNIIDAKIDKLVKLNPSFNKEHPVYDHPDAMSLGSGCVWYIIIMVVGSIFKDRFLLWTSASLIFWPWYFNKPRFKK